MYAAHDALGDRAIAVTAVSKSFPERERMETKAFCESLGIRHLFVESEELQIEGFSHNPVNRCYLCKTELFTKLKEIADTEGIAVVAEGSNLDDNGDYQPGLQAVKELGIASPLREAGLTKQNIREISKELGLKTWNKQSFACLSSRFVYGETRREPGPDRGAAGGIKPHPLEFRKIGFVYVTMDLSGYRTGSMNAALNTGGQ